MSLQLAPEEIALLVALSRMKQPGIPALIDDYSDNVGRSFLVGSVQFPPRFGTLNRSLPEEDKWYGAFNSLLRNRRFITLDRDKTYKMTGVGWQFVEQLESSEIKDSDGSVVWNKIEGCLDDLAKAQANGETEEIVRLDGLLLQLSEKLIKK